MLTSFLGCHMSPEPTLQVRISGALLNEMFLLFAPDLSGKDPLCASKPQSLRMSSHLDKGRTGLAKHVVSC